MKLLGTGCRILAVRNIASYKRSCPIEEALRESRLFGDSVRFRAEVARACLQAFDRELPEMPELEWRNAAAGI
jgi:hypothetical protein